MAPGESCTRSPRRPSRAAWRCSAWARLGCSLAAGGAASSLVDPYRRRRDLVRRPLTGVGAVGGGREPADRLDAHVVVALDLTAQPQARCSDQAARREDVFFRLGHLLWLAGDELHAASGAAGEAAAGVHLIDLR